GEISAGGQCRVERCYQVARDDTSGQYVALKTAALSFDITGDIHNSQGGTGDDN
ncbi:hypothetical protein MLW56_26140, partial [Escherichia coli]|nr:hypothetical protein [Escherichia coli]MCN6058124.1 hypothetical protein [Escherichia coli]MCN6454516.1 hypothetical protein [Escherichia coli]